MDSQKRPEKSGPDANWGYRRQGLANLLRMGHCAPTVMQTLLDVSSAEKVWMVRLSAGMPGGIGNTGHECGGLTSPLAQMGIRFGLHHDDQGLPEIFDRGHALSQQFIACHKTMKCREIRGKDRFPRHCILPVLRSPEIFLSALEGDQREAIPASSRVAYSRLYAHMVENHFHCARAVLSYLGYAPDELPELFDAVSAFMGGTLFMGRTCSAFTAGVMGLGLKAGEIENSPIRVVRLLAIMTVGGKAFDDRLNKFNPSMNRGYRLARWFTNEFGSTQCRAITQCDFSNLAGVGGYIQNDWITKCRGIAEKVAGKVQEILGELQGVEGFSH
jgi:hypothetical protein